MKCNAGAQVGYGKEVISRGTYAELLTDNRSFTEAEEQYFKDSAQVCELSDVRLGFVALWRIRAYSVR
jgi:hypothetical protein